MLQIAVFFFTSQSRECVDRFVLDALWCRGRRKNISARPRFCPYSHIWPPFLDGLHGLHRYCSFKHAGRHDEQLI